MIYLVNKAKALQDKGLPVNNSALLRLWLLDLRREIRRWKKTRDDSSVKRILSPRAVLFWETHAKPMILKILSKEEEEEERQPNGNTPDLLNADPLKPSEELELRQCGFRGEALNGFNTPSTHRILIWKDLVKRILFKHGNQLPSNFQSFVFGTREPPLDWLEEIVTSEGDSSEGDSGEGDSGEGDSGEEDSGEEDSGEGDSDESE